MFIGSNLAVGRFDLAMTSSSEGLIYLTSHKMQADKSFPSRSGLRLLDRGMKRRSVTSDRLQISRVESAVRHSWRGTRAWSSSSWSTRSHRR